MLENEIRVLTILPYGVDGPQAPLKCERHVVNLSDNPVYDTLSYRWGGPDTRHIRVDSQDISVTENLHAALLHLRQKDEKESTWIDQVRSASQSAL